MRCYECDNDPCRCKEKTMDRPSCGTCKHCGGLIAVRNPTGKCDHLYWPDNLTDEAKRANGFRLVTRQVWEPNVALTGLSG